MKGAAKEIIFLVEESPEGGYEARALGHAIITEADSFEELKERVRDAVHCHFDEEEHPAVIRLHTEVAHYLETDRQTLSQELFGDR